MRDNDLLDGAWDAPEEPAPKPTTWKRKSCRDLDKLMGVEGGDYEDDLFVPVKVSSTPKPKPAKKRTAKAKPVRRNKRRAKATRVDPEEAVAQLQKWVKKLLLARKKVQKYRQAVKRYQAQGRI